MDLKIKDVAELLNVSETTIRRWLTDGKIPAYRINHQYRFSRIEIENWVMECKLSAKSGFAPFAQQEVQIYPTVTEEAPEPSASRAGTQQFSLYRAIHKGGVFSDIAGENKEQLIRNTAQLIAPRLGIDPEVLGDLLLDREKLMPTALNHGIAVPHTRDFVLQGPSDFIAVVFPKEPIEYGSLDGKPVHTLFFLFSGEDKRHLHLLAKLAHLSSSPAALEKLQSKPSLNDLLDYVREWEAQIRGQSE